MLTSQKKRDHVKMIKDKYLNIEKLVSDKKIFRLFRAVESHGGVLRFVGGAVRNALRGMGGSDLDLATDLSPDELVEACQESGLKTVPIGIKFGTVGVVINGKVLEVTSLRKDVKSDGRHSEVEFTTDWEIDASRRDLTINAVYADEKGNVFDYYNGISDLENGIVRFIGSPTVRIKEDYLRILRFFRFYSMFGKGEIDQKALSACVENKEGLRQLSAERIRDELSKILLTPQVVKVIKIMADNGILDTILPVPKNYDKLAFLIEMCNQEHLESNWLRRLYIVFEPDEALAENLANRLKLSKKDKMLFVSWAQHQPQTAEFLDEKSLLKLIYRYGKEFCYHKLILNLAAEKKYINNLNEILEFINAAEIPLFPIRGRDLLEKGVAPNEKIGATLKLLENEWIESGFKMSREELLQKAI